MKELIVIDRVKQDNVMAIPRDRLVGVEKVPDFVDQNALVRIISSKMICLDIVNTGDFCGKAFSLSACYDWKLGKDDKGNPILVPLKRCSMFRRMGK